MAKHPLRDRLRPLLLPEQGKKVVITSFDRGKQISNVVEAPALRKTLRKHPELADFNRPSPRRRRPPAPTKIRTTHHVPGPDPVEVVEPEIIVEAAGFDVSEPETVTVEPEIVEPEIVVEVEVAEPSHVPLDGGAHDEQIEPQLASDATVGDQASVDHPTDG